jgi:multimeric flavodoxin WrbA
MQKAIISIVYHSNHGHTEQVANMLAECLRSDQTIINIFHVSSISENWEPLHISDVIIFGSPTYFGNVSADFKSFMERTGSFWYKQCWKNKMAAAFTVSSSTCGDKLNTLQSLSLFAAQHSMLWISQGILPRYLNDQQTDGQNRLASYLGMMIQSDNSQQSVHPLHPGDLLTIELFAERIKSIVCKHKNIELNIYDTVGN